MPYPQTSGKFTRKGSANANNSFVVKPERNLLVGEMDAAIF
jgi:hypothetical protein